MAEPHYRVLVLGLDGATFDLMLPWIEAGDLPCLEGLLRGGAHSPLTSTIPPITPCAWSSFMTGKNPGKHGLFDFVEPLADGHGFQFTNATCRKGETLWGILSRHDQKVGVVNVPMTYPPEEVNGYLISGLDTPHEHSPYMYPSTIRQELKQQSIRYRIDLQHLGNMRTDDRRRRQLDEIFAAESARTKAFQYLSRTYPADFRMIVYGATDQVQHHFWHYMDPSHDKHDAQGAKLFADAIRKTYIHIDQLLASVLEECGEETIVVVMSDHGFGPTTNVRLRLNQALKETGLLTFKQEKQAGRVKRTVAGAADRVLRSTLSPDMKRTIAGMFPKLRVWFETLDEAKVDWSRTLAYVNEAHRSSPAIWLNGRGDSPQSNGSGANGSGATGNGEFADRRKVTEEIEQMIKALKDPSSDTAAVSNVYRTKDLYHGPYTDKAPDLLVSWWEDGFLLEQSSPQGEFAGVERCTAPIQGGVEFAGSHRLGGVFMIHGGPTRKDFAFDGANIVDVAPTVLYLMGHPLPNDMDGRVLTECLDPEYLASHPIRYEDAQDESTDEPGNQQPTYTEDEAAMIQRRLQALGYIE